MVYIPTELVLEILVRLPWTSLRRLRLVCRTWRDLVHDRTTEMKQCRDAVPLVVTTESVYVLDGQGSSNSKTGTPRELWPGRIACNIYKNMEVVGACNGVLCLCDDTKPGGVITLANPATGDALSLPSIPCTGLFRRHNTRRPRSWHQAYSFGYHHATGQYKVVHVPCFFKTKEMLHVFTLGEVSWREVPAPGARCRLDANIVSVNGNIYWVTEGLEEKIMCFNLRSEQVRSTKPLPVVAKRPIYQLTHVHRKLSAATCDQISESKSIQVWVLESTKKEQACWTLQYSFRFLPLHWLSKQPQLPRPIFMYNEYNQMFGAFGEQGHKLFGIRHKPTSDVTRSECNMVYIHEWFRNPLVSGVSGDICRTFMYIETTEALSVHRRW